MRKSGRITLTLVAAAALASCRGHGQDPCAAATFNEQFCQDAVRNGGYYWNGAWFPMVYSYPYPHYYDSYNRYRAGGGVVTASPGVHYGRPSGSVDRGGFGATGAGHASGVGE
jgi:hypothetical protein